MALAAYPRYLGLDISPAAVEMCRQRFQMDATKAFAVLDDRVPEPHDLTLSLDVIYHLVENAAFDADMALLFGCASSFVAIYSSNAEHRAPEPHIRHRNFTAWVNENCPD